MPQTHQNQENEIGNIRHGTYDLPMMGLNGFHIVGEIIFDLEFCPQNVSIKHQVK